MKNLILLICLLFWSVVGNSQYDGDKLPSGLITTESTDSLDYVIIQQDGDTYVKAIQMRYVRDFISSQIVVDIPTVDSIDGESGQFIISDGVGWLSPANARYEGYSSFTFGARFPADSAIGIGSTVFGHGYASGQGSFAVYGGAIGDYAISLIGSLVTGNFSFSFGSYNSVSGDYSVNSGGKRDSVSGDYAFHGGGYGSNLSGDYSVNGGGSNNDVSGSHASNGGGKNNNVSGGYASNGGGDINNVSGGSASNGGGSGNNVSGISASNGGGHNNNLSGDYASNVGGDNNNVTGDKASNVGGQYNYSQSYAETTIGLYNDTAATHNKTTYVETDRLITIGNGTGTAARSNAFVMLKNGNTTANGDWTIDGDMTVTGSLTNNVTEVSIVTVLLPSDNILHVLIGCTITIPSAQIVDGREITIKDATFNASVENITIVTEGAETIDGAANLLIDTDGGSYTLYFYDGNVFIK